MFVIHTEAVGGSRYLHPFLTRATVEYEAAHANLRLAQIKSDSTPESMRT